jgi:FMN phosphatase YigB (HAD superfamily)
MTTQLLRSPRRRPRLSDHLTIDNDLHERQPSPVATERSPRLTPAALLFACENVLYDATVWDRWLVRLLRHVGVAIDQETFGRQWEPEFLREIHAGRREFDEAFRDYLWQLGLSRGLTDEVAAASQGLRHQFLRDTRPLPHIRQTIAALAQMGLGLGLLADSELSAAELERHLTRLGFGGRFQFVLSSVELGTTKAGIDGYRAAAARLGLPPERIAYVGNVSEHLGPAASLGMSTIAFNYDEPPVADFKLHRFDALIDVLKNWPADS